MLNNCFFFKKPFLYSQSLYIYRKTKSIEKKLYVKSLKNQNTEEGVNILWNCSFDKGRLKSFVSWFLLHYGEKKTIELLEQLKNIGFGYATKAGISLGIDDLKIPPQKSNLLFQAEWNVAKGIEKYKKGKITGVERLQQLIDVWNQTSEFLKQEVVKYFEKIDLFNPVYMMAFSGARGNLSQVRQLVGMRGLMSDPQGNIIDFPIQSNFREGLTLTEYIISTYGARKGIVDTALRTATAGYLTRRLVDVAQHVIISQFDCGTTRGIFVFDMKDGNKTIYSFQNRLIGRVLARDIFEIDSKSLIPSKKIANRNQEVSSTLATAISKITKKAFVRSPLTCETRQLVCQLCYGWSLSNNRLVSLGEAVGVIAAQSIGEPGTQLTMRTFHTGGVFSGGATNQIVAPYNGFIEYLDAVPGTCVRIPQGDIAFLTKAPGSFLLIENDSLYSEKTNLKKKSEFHTIPGYAILFFKNKQQFKEKQILAQFSTVALQQRGRGKAEQTIYANLEGQISFYQIDLLEQQNEKLLEDIVWRAIDWSKIWILSGKNYVDPLGLNSFPQKGDLVNKNSVFQKVYWYPLNSGSIDLYISKNSSVKSINFTKTKKRGFPNQLTTINSSLRINKNLIQNFSKNFYQSMYKQTFVLFSNKKMNLKKSPKNIKNICLKSILFSKKEKRHVKKINSYKKLFLKYSYLKVGNKNHSFFLLKQSFSNFYFYPFKTKIRSFLLKKIHRLDFISNLVLSKELKKRQKPYFKEKNLQILMNPFNIKLFIPNYLRKKSVKKKRFLRFNSFYTLLQKKIAFNKKNKTVDLSINTMVNNKFVLYLNSTCSKKPYFIAQRLSLPSPQQRKYDFYKKAPSFLLKKPLLNLPIQKITFKKFGYIFSIKRNFFSKTHFDFNSSDKVFSFFPLIQKEMFSINNFSLNDPGKNSQSLSLGNTQQWGPFPKTTFRWFPSESHTNTSGLFIWRKPFFSNILEQNNLNQIKEILNEKVQELYFKNSHFIEKKRWISIESVLKKMPKKEIKILNLNLFKIAFCFKRKKFKKSFNYCRQTNLLNLQPKITSSLKTRNKSIRQKNLKPIKFSLQQKEVDYQFLKLGKQKKSLQFRYLSTKNFEKKFITKKQQNKNFFSKFTKFSVYTQDFYFVPQENFKLQIWDQMNKKFLSNKMFSNSEIFLTNRQGLKKQLKTQVSGFKKIYKKWKKNKKSLTSNVLSYKQNKSKILVLKRKVKNKIDKKFLLSCFCKNSFKHSNLIENKKSLSPLKKAIFVSKFYKKFNPILQLSIRNQMFNNLKKKLISKSKKIRKKNLEKNIDSFSLIAKKKNQSLFFSCLPIKSLKKSSIFNSKKELKIEKNSLLNHTQVEGVTKPGWIYFLLDFDKKNYHFNLKTSMAKNLLKMHTNSNSFLSFDFGQDSDFSNFDLIFKLNSNSKFNLELNSLNKYYYVKNLHKKFVDPGKKLFHDLCFEQNKILIENLLVDERKASPIKGNFTQVFKNKKARFFKNINQENQILLKSFFKDKKLALLLRPVQYNILQNAQIYKIQLYQSHMNLQDNFVSFCFYSNYHSKLLNQQNCQNKILSNFPVLDLEIQQNLPVSFFEKKLKKKKKIRKKEMNSNKNSILFKEKNHISSEELKAFYSAYQNPFFSLLLKNSKPLGLNFSFHSPIFYLNSPFQNSNLLLEKKSLSIIYNYKNSLNFGIKDQNLLLSLSNKTKFIYKLLEKNQFRIEILFKKESNKLKNGKKKIIGDFLLNEQNLLKNAKNIYDFQNLLSISLLSPLVFEWSLGRKEAYLINQKFGISSFLKQKLENKILFANSAKSSIYKEKIKDNKIKEYFPYNKNNKQNQNTFVSFPRIKNSFILYKVNFVQLHQVFATTNLFSPFEGELLTNNLDSMGWWNELGDTFVTNQTKKIKNFIFLTKKDIFCVPFFPSNFDQKNIELNLKTESSISFNEMFNLFFKNKKQQNQKQLFKSYFNSIQFLSILKQENPVTKNSYKINSFFTKYQNRIFHLKGLSVGKPADKNIYPYGLGNYLLRGDPVFLQRKMSKNGQIIHFNLKKVTLRYAQPFLISPKGMLHVNQGDFIYKNAPILTLPFETLTTGDIVQGIPKVEQYLEARTTQNGRFFLYSLPVLLKAIFERYRNKLPLEQAVAQSFLKIQQILVDGVQRVYRSQGVSIAEKHLEVIVKQMTSKVQIIHGGQTGFFPGELVDLEIVEGVNKFLMIKIRYEPVVLGITRASLEVQSFLSAASFQQTTKILAKASLSKKKDYLKGLKENLLVGNLIPAGTGFMSSFKAKEPILNR